MILVGFERPKMVRNMLKSIKDQTYDNWHLHVIDDGSRSGLELRPVVEEVLKDYLDKITFDYIPDSIEQKELQGGSRHGLFMTDALKNIDGDIYICLCDDDCLFPDYLEKLNSWYKDHPDIIYSYCHASTFDPFVESYPNIPTRGWALNYTHDLYGSCVIDSCQGSYRYKKLIEAGVHYPFGLRNLDSSWYQQISDIFGLCTCNHIMGQYKAIFSDQMGSRHNSYNIRDLP